MRIDLTPDAVARCIDEVGFGFMFAPAAPRRHALRGPGAQGARGAHDLQLPRPADQPGGRHAPGHRRVGPRVPGDASPARSRRLGAVKALVVSSEDGLDEMSTAGTTHGRRGRRRRAAHSYALAPEDVGLRARPLRGRRRRPARRQRRHVTRRIFAGEAGPARDLAVLNAGAAIYVAGRVDTLEAGVRAAEEALDSGAAARGARHDSSRSRRSWPPLLSNVLERIVGATREELERRRRERPARPARGRARPAARGPPVRRGARRAPASRVIAEHKRRSPSAGTIREGATRRPRSSQAYERGGAAALSILTEERALRRLARGPARGARGHRAAGPAQGLHRRPATSSTRRRRPAPTRSC